MITKESLVDLQEKYEKVKKLIDEDARFDPETEPFFSKYAARQNLISMNALLENLKEKQGPDGLAYHKLVGMHGAVQLQLGIVAVDTEEVSIGEKHLNDALKIIENYEALPEVASVALSVYNQLGIIFASREVEQGQVQLEKAEAFYKKIIADKVIPMDYNDLFIVNYELDEVKAMEKFEKIFTLTLYYLAQVYGLADPLRSAVYCHRTLQRQLESKDYEPIDWALNTATLSQFLMEKNWFKQARHHLSASLYMLDELKKTLHAIEDHNEEYDAKIERFKYRSADIARCWGKYGLSLLINSRDRLMASADSDTPASLCTDVSQLKLEENTNVTVDDLKNFDFNLDLTQYESQITDQFILAIEDAKLVFLNVQKWLNKAQEYYTMNTMASDFIEIAGDQSKLYDALVFFEENPETRTKLIKRAIDILENVLAEINVTYFMRYCRQMWFCLGKYYCDILDIKLDKLKETDVRPSPHALTKINMLVDKSIQHFRSFINSFANPAGELPSRVASDVEKPYLQAYFHIAAIQTRHVTLDKQTQLKNTEKSLEAYNTFVAYCKANEKAEECVTAEMSIAREMVTLLPLKIARIRSEL